VIEDVEVLEENRRRFLGHLDDLDTLDHL